MKKFLKKRMEEIYTKVKKGIESKNKAVKVRFEHNEKVLVDLTNIQNVFKNRIILKLEELEAKFGLQTKQVEYLRDEVSDLATASLAQRKTLSNLAKGLQNEKDNVENLEIQCTLINAKVESLENNVFNSNCENIKNNDTFDIPDEPRRVTMRRKVKNKSPDPTTSPITDAEEVSSTRVSEAPDGGVTLEDLKASIEEFRDSFQRKDKKPHQKRVSISGDDDPSDTSSSSSEDSDGEDKKPRKSKKKKKREDTSSDSDSSSKSEESDITQGIAALNRDRSRSVFKDEEDGFSDVPRRSRHGFGGAEVLTLKNLLDQIHHK